MLHPPMVVRCMACKTDRGNREEGLSAG
jgi:hypothetical protein